MNVWAVHLIVRDLIFASTHRATEAAIDLDLLGWRSSDYARLWTPFTLLALVGRRASTSRLRPGSAPFWVKPASRPPASGPDAPNHLR